MEKIELCPNPECNAKLNWASDRCPVCNNDLGPPTIRLAKQDEKHLNNRYTSTIENSKNRNIHYKVIEFEHKVKKSRAIFNCDAHYLFGFLESNNVLFANYRLQVASSIRKVADMKNDRQRSGVESLLYGSVVATQIEYAALSIDNLGLISYGCCSVVLKDITMKSKAVVLEENSYDFVKKNEITTYNLNIPKGYLSDWDNRHKLAVAKNYNKLTSGENDYRKILLSSNGNRGEDDFMEVHIYGGFDNQAISYVSLPKIEKYQDDNLGRLKLKCIYTLTEQSNISVVTYD